VPSCAAGATGSARSRSASRWRAAAAPPGLRREEVAQLAGLGVTWYTWLEQGRDIRPSVQVLQAIAKTLRLDRHERNHLFTLAGATDTLTPDDSSTVEPSVRLLLDRLEPYPALAINGRYDLLAFNRIWASSFPGVESLPLEDRNCLWLIFTEQSWRDALPDWDSAAARMAAQYRAAMAEHVGEPAWTALVARLQSASPEFAEVWKRHDVKDAGSHVKRFVHPTAGLLSLERTYLWLDQRRRTRIVVYTPADKPTSRRLERLHRSLD